MKKMLSNQRCEENQHAIIPECAINTLRRCHKMNQRFIVCLKYLIIFSSVAIFMIVIHQQSFITFFDFKYLDGVFDTQILKLRSKVKMKMDNFTMKNFNEFSNQNDTSGSRTNYSFPILKGWPPEKSINLVDYLQPEVDTTLIFPRILKSAEVETPGPGILIVCQSSWSTLSLSLRKSIRSSWGDSGFQNIVTIFLLGTSKNLTAQSALEEESETFGDILQEDFVDTYNNLTLKSMFMLKFLTRMMNLENSFQYVFKVDDDCYVNSKPLLRFIKSHSIFSNVIFGHTLGEKNLISRPSKNSTERFITNKWEVPHYLYPGKSTFPNAISGSGYILKIEDLECLYNKGLETPFLNLEDIFLTGLVARQCHVKLVEMPKLKYMGVEDICKGVDQQDVLIHHIKTPERMLNLHRILTGQITCSSENQLQILLEN